MGRPAEEGFEFAEALELPFGIAEVVGDFVVRGDLAGSVDGEAFVDQQLAERCPGRGHPVVIVAAQLGDQAFEVAGAVGRGVSHRVRQLVTDPQGNQLG